MWAAAHARDGRGADILHEIGSGYRSLTRRPALCLRHPSKMLATPNARARRVSPPDRRRALRRARSPRARSASRAEAASRTPGKRRPKSFAPTGDRSGPPRLRRWSSGTPPAEPPRSPSASCRSPGDSASNGTRRSAGTASAPRRQRRRKGRFRSPRSANQPYPYAARPTAARQERVRCPAAHDESPDSGRRRPYPLQAGMSASVRSALATGPAAPGPDETTSDWILPPRPGGPRAPPMERRPPRRRRARAHTAAGATPAGPTPNAPSSPPCARCSTPSTASPSTADPSSPQSRSPW
jgi:hypothetical protein